MPKPAFFNLSDDKRNLIISKAVDEFSAAEYDTASINQICIQSNIAKGSFYQYFTGKLDLYIYIMTIALEQKFYFFSSVLNDFKLLTLKEQIRLLFVKGIEFAKEYPQYAALGERFLKESNTSAKSAVIEEGEKKSEALFIQMINNAKLKGEVRNSVDTLALNMILQGLIKTVNEYTLNILNSTGNTACNQIDTNELVDSLLNIIFDGINPI